MRLLIVLSIILLGLGFSNPEQQKAYDNLVNEIRCVTCPNQCIADSYAPIAVSMRDDIARRIEQGETEAQIREYLLSRYGDYISYRPSLQKETWALWFGPALCLLIGIGFWLRSLRNRKIL